ncbi:MAG: hypothetical protein ACI86S_000804 [Paracoccaceae bacterium]|jgi:hypothetical protein
MPVLVTLKGHVFDAFFRPTTLIILCGLGYGAATLAMHAAATTPSPFAITAIVLWLAYIAVLVGAAILST